MSASDSEEEGTLIVLTVDADVEGQRLDQWLAMQLASDLSRSRVQALIKQGAVRVAGKTIDKTGRKLATGDEIVVDIPDAKLEAKLAEPQGEDIPLDIIFEDDELIVINKPAGLMVHPGAGRWTGTLVNALIQRCGDSLSGIGGVKRPGIVHRLDKETSGVMVVAKTDRAHKSLSEAFADHGRTGDLERAYNALVWGVMPRMTGTIDAHLGRHVCRVRRAVVPEHRDDARHAVTHYTVQERFGEYQTEFTTASLIECRLETGRTHQIRVHMAHIGYPVVGDRVYGQAFRTKSNRLPEPLKSAVKALQHQALHARFLAFRHPTTNSLMRFEVPLPRDMRELVEGFHNLLNPDQET